MAERKNQFKNLGRTEDELRRRRNEVTVELRKSKREESLQKRRNVPTDLDTSGDGSESGIEGSKGSAGELVTIASILEQAVSPDPETRQNAIRNARRALSREKNPPIDEFIQSGLMPLLVRCLSEHRDAKLQFEAAWALTNIASGTSAQTQAVVQCGAVEVFIELLSSPVENVCEQAVWALGNIIGDGPRLRDYCIEKGVLDPLLRLIQPSMSLSFLRVSPVSPTRSSHCCH